MKKTMLTILAAVIALTTVLSITGFAMARTDPMTDEVTVVNLGLVINAPASAKAGQPLKIQVLTRPGRPVERAEVWAVNLGNPTNETTLTRDAASVVTTGVLLGRTNERGYVDPAPRLWREGRYMLVAIKPNFDPGFFMMKIAPPQPLNLRAPDTARLGQIVPMSVTGPDGQGIPRVALFSIPLLNTTDSANPANDYSQLVKDAAAYAEILEDPAAEAELKADREAYDRIMKMRRYFIGFTDRNGEFKYRFPQAGPHLLIAAKWGYLPDFHLIKITRLQPEAAEAAPIKLEADTPTVKKLDGT